MMRSSEGKCSGATATRHEWLFPYLWPIDAEGKARSSLAPESSGPRVKLLRDPASSRSNHCPMFRITGSIALHAGSYSLERGHAHQLESTGHDLLECLDQGKPKNPESLILKMNKRSLDLCLRVRMLIEIGEGSGKAKNVFCKL